ncbi:MAG: hypothetical protein N2512_00160 [Armatimonadetes bacterium]|nr:hypothetical protein [Armatimonadota bacterium]
MGATLAGLVLALVAVRFGQLAPSDVARLVVVEDRTVDGVIARQVAEAAGGVIVGGEEDGSGRFLVMLLDAPSAKIRAFPSPAAPYFAINPSGESVAYWRLVPAEDPVRMAELVAADLRSGEVQPLSGPTMLPAGGRLVWPLPGNLVFALSRPLPDGQFGVLWRLDIATGRSVCLLSKTAAAGPGMVCRGASPDTVVFADSSGALSVPITGAESSPTDLWAALYPRPGSRSWLILEPRVTLGGEASGAQLHFAGTDAAWAPGGEACLVAGGGKLFAAPADLSFARKLLGWRSVPREFTCPLWKENLGEAVVGAWGPSPAIHLFSLGTETIEVSVFFPGSLAPQPGAKVWVARNFLFDAKGALVKPDWPTLKACLVVRWAMPEGDGVRVRCENYGLEPGVIDRLAAPDAQPADFSELATTRAGKKTVWLRRWSLPARTDLRAWVDGLPVLGTLGEVTVELRRLDAP